LAAANKKVKMIRHNHVPPKCDIKLGNRATTVLLKSILSGIQRRNVFAIAGSKSDEVEWLIDVDQIKPTGTVLDHSSDCRGSRAGCNPFAFAGDILAV
jgi:hypothetical protein